MSRHDPPAPTSSRHAGAPPSASPATTTLGGSTARRWPGRVAAATLIPALLFGLTEVALRAAGYGEVTSRTLFSTRTSRAGEVWWQRAPDKNDPWYPPYREIKPEGTVRIACVGGSTVAGLPIPEYAFPVVLQERLRALVPDREVEVLGCGVGGLYSDGELKVLREVLALDPDVVVLYSCHNEFHHQNVADLLARHEHPLLDRARRAVERLAITHAIRAAMSRDAAGPVKAEATLDRAPPERRPIDGVEFQLVVDHFRDNLNRFAELCEDRSIPLVVCTVTSNLRDFPPMANVFSPSVDDAARAEWKARFDESLAASSAGDYDAALALAEEAAAIDATPAGTYFARVWALLGLGRRRLAHKEFSLARDYDGRLNRAPTILNDVVRQVAAQRGDLVAEVERAFEERAPNGLVGHELIVDNVHPNQDGHALIAETIVETLATAGLLIDAAALERDAGPTSRAVERVAIAEMHERIGFQNLILALEKGRPGLTTAIAKRHFDDSLMLEDRAGAHVGLALIHAIDHSWTDARRHMTAGYDRDPQALMVYAEAARQAPFVRWLFEMSGVRFAEAGPVLLDPK